LTANKAMHPQKKLRPAGYLSPVCSLDPSSAR